MSIEIPTGFRRVDLAHNPFLDRIGPLYARLADGEFVLGFRVEPGHCNPGGTCHGGMMSTLADMLLILGANAQANLQRYMSAKPKAQEQIKKLLADPELMAALAERAQKDEE